MSRSIGCRLTLVVALALGVTACGSSSHTSSATSSSAGTPTSSSSSRAAATAAQQAIEPYIGKPTPFPVSQPLKRVPRGATIAYMDCGTPICAYFYQLLSNAAQTMGVKLTRIKAGSTAATASPAYDTAVSLKPAAVISANVMDLWKNQLKALQAAHIPVVTVGVTGTKPYGIISPQAAETSSLLEGPLEADYVLAHFGSHSNVAFYYTPELTFTLAIETSFQQRLMKICPACSVRSVPIPVATFGSTAPSMVVADLQAHPQTNVIVFGTNEVAYGLPAALKGAGITVKSLSQGPDTTALQYIKAGQQSAGLGVDFPVLVWTLLDEAAREITGQKLVGREAQGLTDYQFLTQKDITFNPANGWTGYSDYAKRFAKLWGTGS